MEFQQPQCHETFMKFNEKSWKSASTGYSLLFPLIVVLLSFVLCFFHVPCIIMIAGGQGSGITQKSTDRRKKEKEVAEKDEQHETDNDDEEESTVED
jgi:flagellar biosynthesis/type III secretory pathway M-ring protein FliF/YscJ